MQAATALPFASPGSSESKQAPFGEKSSAISHSSE
jgi:hypothetical protein